NWKLRVTLRHALESRFETKRALFPRVHRTATKSNSAQFLIDISYYPERSCIRYGDWECGHGLDARPRYAADAGSALPGILCDGNWQDRIRWRRELASVYVCSEGEYPRTHVHSRHANY